MSEHLAVTAAPTPHAAAISDADAAAVIVMLLAEAQATRLLSGLDPHELKLLGEKMCRLGEITPAAIVQALSGFIARTDEPALLPRDRIGHVRGIMTRAVGEMKADNMMARVQPDIVPTSSIELARWLNAPAILPLIKGEHPQAIAVLLLQLDPDIAAEVLAALPTAEQTPVVHRIATMGPVAPHALEMLEELLSRRLNKAAGGKPLILGGARSAADILNNSGRLVEKRVMPEIAKLDKRLARRIEEEMFKFEHVFALDAKAMGTLLNEVDSDVLITALKGIDTNQREVFFQAMSSRAADGVKDEIEARSRIKLADVLEAQRRIIAAARLLAADGVIAFGAGGADDEYV